MRARYLVGLAAIALAAVACGGGGAGPESSDAGSTTVASEPVSGGGNGTDDGGTPAGGSTGEVTPEAQGELEPNTIRIGSQVWKRTLPMTSGQCVIFQSDGTLPDWGTVWGTVDGDEDSHFSATYGQDGTFEADVNNNFDQYWGAGSRFQAEPDLVIELDFDNLILSGSGTFHSLNTAEDARGSFTFTCEPEDQ